MSRRTRHQGTSDETTKPKRLQCELFEASALPKALHALLPRHPSPAYAYQASDNSDILLPFVDGLIILSEQAGECCLPPTAKVLCALVDGKVPFYPRYSLTQRSGLDLHSSTSIPFIPRSATECSSVLARWHSYHQGNNRPFNAWRCLVIGAVNAQGQANDAAQRCAMVIRSGGGIVLECDDELDASKFLDMQLTHLFAADELFIPINRWAEQNSFTPLNVLKFSRLEELILSDESALFRPGSKHPQRYAIRNIFPHVKADLLSNMERAKDKRLLFPLRELLETNKESSSGLVDIEVETLNHIEDQLGDRAKCTDDSLFIALSLLPLQGVAVPADLFLHMFRVALEGYSAPNSTFILKQEALLDKEADHQSTQKLSSEIQEDIFFNGSACLRWFAFWQESNVHNLSATRNILTEVCRTLCRQYVNTTAEMLQQLNVVKSSTKAKLHAGLFYDFIFMLLTDGSPEVDTLQKLHEARLKSGKRSKRNNNDVRDRALTKRKRNLAKQNAKGANYDDAADSYGSSSSDDELDVASVNVDAGLAALGDAMKAANQISIAQLKIERFLIHRLAAESFIEYLGFDLSSQIVATNVAAAHREVVAPDAMEVDLPQQSSRVEQLRVQANIAKRAQSCFSSQLHAPPAILTLLFPANAGVIGTKVNEQQQTNNDADDVMVVDADDDGKSIGRESNTSKPTSTKARTARGRKKSGQQLSTTTARTANPAVSRAPTNRISPIDNVKFLCPRIFDDLALRVVKLIENERKLHIALRATPSELGTASNSSTFSDFAEFHRFLLSNKTFTTWISLIDLIFDGIVFELSTYYSTEVQPSDLQQTIMRVTMPIATSFACKLFEYCSTLKSSETDEMRFAVFMAVAETTDHSSLRNAVLNCWITAPTKSSARTLKAAFISRAAATATSFESVCRLMLKHDRSTSRSTFEIFGSSTLETTFLFLSQLLRSTYESCVKPLIGVIDANAETGNVYARIFTGTSRACTARKIALSDLAASDGSTGSEKQGGVNATPGKEKVTDDRWLKVVHEIAKVAMIGDSKSDLTTKSLDEAILVRFGEICACYHLTSDWLIAEMFAHPEVLERHGEASQESLLANASSTRGKSRGRAQISKSQETERDQKHIAEKWKRIQEEFFV